MSHVPHPATVRLALAVTVTVVPAALLLPTAALAATSAPGIKAQIEHTERQSAPVHATKAQVERAERTTSVPGPASVPVSADTPTTPVTGGGDAAAWELAVSAAIGATLAGGVLVTSRRVVDHRRPLAS